MLEHYVPMRKHLVAMKRNPLVSYLAKMAAHYHADGYCHRHARRSLSFAARFGQWLRRRRISPAAVTEQHIEQYLRPFTSSPPEKINYHGRMVCHAVHFVVSLIPDRVVPPPPPPSPSQVETERYVEYLRRHRGVSP